MGKLINGFKNIIKFKNLLFTDCDKDYIFIDKILLQKLKNVYKIWGNDTNYIGDYNDKEDLKKLIREFEDFIKNEPKLSPEISIKNHKKLYAKIGEFIPRLWD